MHPSFVTSLHHLIESNRPFVIATVVQVDGSVSARLGSRALFDEHGGNVYGWVGGGCAEIFVGEQAIEAIQDQEPRTVLANLDNEVFGLGVACGGTMQVFIEPHYPPEPVKIARPLPAERENKLKRLAAELDVEPDWTSGTFRADTMEDLVYELSLALARSRDRTAGHLRETVGSFHYRPAHLVKASRALLIGQSRITEALSQYLVQLGYHTTISAPGVDKGRFPAGSGCHCLDRSLSAIPFDGEAITVVGSHHASDSQIVRDALAAGSPYVALIASHSRTVSILNELGLQEDREIDIPFFAPAGIDIDCRTPREIALSIAAEIVTLSRLQKDGG